MAKEKTVYICSECGHREAKWAGRCVVCGAWNTFVEENIRTKMKFSSGEKKTEPVPLSRVCGEEKNRIDCGTEEFNRVLGGGLTADSSVLIGGRPGIGKSTLLLQTAASAKTESVLYVSGEESAAQIKARAIRLGLSEERITLLIENDLEAMTAAVRSLKPQLVIIDSIQTVICREAGSIPGTVNQMTGNSESNEIFSIRTDFRLQGNRRCAFFNGPCDERRRNCRTETFGTFG